MESLRHRMLFGLHFSAKGLRLCLTPCPQRNSCSTFTTDAHNPAEVLLNIKVYCTCSLFSESVKTCLRSTSHLLFPHAIRLRRCLPVSINGQTERNWSGDYFNVTNKNVEWIWCSTVTMIFCHLLAQFTTILQLRQV